MSICAVVLAGGQGTRMGGVDKGLVEFKGRKMIEWTLDVVKPCVTEVLISCNRNITDYMPLADSVVCDRIAGSLGPLAGIHAAMELSNSISLLVLPCDTPFINTKLVNKLLKASEESPEAIIMLIDSDHAHPLHAVIPQQLKESLQDYLIEGGRAVRKWYFQHDVIEISIDEDDKYALVNINNSTELEVD